MPRRCCTRCRCSTPVRQFVLFSSISGLLGSRWLGHYAATSTFLDTFAYARRNLGLPATAINWGLWKSLADNQSDARQVTIGDRPGGRCPTRWPSGRCRWAMSPGAPVGCAVVDADWPRLAAAYRTRGSLRIVDDLLTERPTPRPRRAKAEFRHGLRQCPPERRRQLLVDHIAALASAVMGLAPPQTLDPSTGFFQLGMDSLMSVTLQRNLSDTLGEPLTPRGRSSTTPPSTASPHTWPRFFPNWPTVPTDPSEPMSTPTPTSPKTNCCNNSPRGWADHDEHRHAGSPRDHHRGAAQDR